MKNILFLLVLSICSLSGSAQKLTNSSSVLKFKVCSVKPLRATKTATLDTTVAGSFYARVGNSAITVENCGSVYIFKSFDAKPNWQPAFSVNDCLGNLDLAMKSIQVNQEYVFMLSKKDTYLSKPNIRLLLIHPVAASIKIIDSGTISSDMTYDEVSKSLSYIKNGKKQQYRLYK